jgi:hypothetical protein
LNGEPKTCAVSIGRVIVLSATHIDRIEETQIKLSALRQYVKTQTTNQKNTYECATASKQSSVIY